MSAVTVVATLRAAKGKADALAALLCEQVGVVRKTPRALSAVEQSCMRW